MPQIPPTPDNWIISCGCLVCMLFFIMCVVSCGLTVLLSQTQKSETNRVSAVFSARLTRYRLPKQENSAWPFTYTCTVNGQKETRILTDA
jgi:hypothetical protein